MAGASVGMSDPLRVDTIAPTQEKRHDRGDELGTRDGVRPGGCDTYVLIEPPSTAMVCPVMKSLSGEHRKMSAPTRSCGWPSRWMARLATTRSRANPRWSLLARIESDSVRPGASVL